MGRLKRQRGLHVQLQILQGLPRQGVHDVQVKGVKGLGRLGQGGSGLSAIVHTAQGLQMGVIETLNADGQAGHAGGAKGFEAVFLKRAGVGF